MPSNLNLVRSIYAAWERGDFSTAEWAHPDVEFVWADGPSPGRRTGIAAIAANFREMLSAWEEFRIEADEYRELDDERVLVLDHRSGRGKRSGLEIGQLRTKGARLFDIRDGKVARLATYFDRDRALADLGLAPERAVNEAGS
jgi:ketosteroid isomerase-like protein